LNFSSARRRCSRRHVGRRNESDRREAVVVYTSPAFFRVMNVPHLCRWLWRLRCARRDAQAIGARASGGSCGTRGRSRSSSRELDRGRQREDQVMRVSPCKQQGENRRGEVCDVRNTIFSCAGPAGAAAFLTCPSPWRTPRRSGSGLGGTARAPLGGREPWSPIRKVPPSGSVRTPRPARCHEPCKFA
jgi:hypothetical protein